MANYIPNKKPLTQEQILSMKNTLSAHNLVHEAVNYIQNIRNKFNLAENEEFYCPFMQKLDKAVKKYLEDNKNYLDSLESDW